MSETPRARRVPPVTTGEVDGIAVPQLLKGQPALSTGANSGIGRAVAIGLATAGADVCVNYVGDQPAAEAVCDEIRKLGRRAIAVQADVSSEEQGEAMFAKAIDTFGTLHLVVANAGLQVDAPFTDMTLAQWNKVISVNLTGQFLCARAAAREFRRRGIDDTVSLAAGRILCMSSVHQQISGAATSTTPRRRAGSC